MKARCNGCGLSAVPSPSGVVTSLSATDHSGASQEETAWSPTMIWQAPHSPAPQPKCGPVRPSLECKNVASSNLLQDSMSAQIGNGTCADDMGASGEDMAP